MKIKLEYVWLDGYRPEPNLRSKVKIVESEVPMELNNIPVWNFDGSSTSQAETGNSDRLLKPVRQYTTHGFPFVNDTVYVLCEVLNPDGTPHESNKRSQIGDNFEDLWFGFEQEYFIREEINGNILGHKRNILKGQGEYYCGVGHNVVGRDFVESHLDMCLNYGIDITGTNAEVALGQWEYQVFSKGKLKGGDDLWYSYNGITPVQITVNGSIAGATGNISGMTPQSAVVFDVATGTFTFWSSQPTSQATIVGSQVRVRATTSSSPVTIAASPTASTYTLTLPSSTPVSQALMFPAQSLSLRQQTQ